MNGKKNNFFLIYACAVLRATCTYFLLEYSALCSDYDYVYGQITPVSYPKLHVSALWLATWAYLYSSPKTRLADNINHPSTYCAVIESYISSHITQTGQLQQCLKLQLAETERTPNVEWNISCNYICVSFSSILPGFSHAHPPASIPHPPSWSHLPLGKLRASLSWPKWERLICSCYLFVINSAHHLLSFSFIQHDKKKTPTQWRAVFHPQTQSIISWKPKWMVKWTFSPVWSHFLYSSSSYHNSPVLSPPPLLYPPQMDVFPSAAANRPGMKMPYLI